MNYKKGLFYAALAVVIVWGVGRLLLGRRDAAQRATRVAVVAEHAADSRDVHVGTSYRRQPRGPAAVAERATDSRGAVRIPPRQDQGPTAETKRKADSRPTAHQARPAPVAVPPAAEEALPAEPAASLGTATQETRSAGAVGRTRRLTPRILPEEAIAPRTPSVPPRAAKPQPGEAPQTSDEANMEEPILEPQAREALADVGSDPVAEAIWISAINDPNLSENDRRNLIEDLNEDGFPDPKNVTIADLPLIVSRMELIEGLQTNAMDDANYEALLEAYKDLAKMYDRLTKP